MKLEKKLARKVSLAVLLSLMNRENDKRDDLSTVLNRRAAETQFIRPPGSG